MARGPSLELGCADAPLQWLLWSRRTGSRVDGLQQLQQVTSVAVAPGLQSTARGILPDPRANLCLLHWQVDALPLSHQGSPYDSYSCTVISEIAVKQGGNSRNLLVGT